MTRTILNDSTVDRLRDKVADALDLGMTEAWRWPGWLDD